MADEKEAEAHRMIPGGALDQQKQQALGEDIKYRHGAGRWNILLPRFRGCCPIVQNGADRIARSYRPRN
jgi:hypothetical protein